MVEGLAVKVQQVRGVHLVPSCACCLCVAAKEQAALVVWAASSAGRK